MLGIAAAGAVLGLASQAQGANSFGQIQRLLDGDHPTGAFQAFLPSPTPETSSAAVEDSTPVQEPPTPEAQPQPQTETEPAVGVEVAESAATDGSTDDVCPDEGSGGLYCVYTVQEGDTLSGIAAALGLEGTERFSPAHLISFSNGLGDPDQAHIQPGQELRIPVLSGVLHTVGASEFLSALAAAYGVSMDEIMAMNGLVDADSLREGTLLLIPSPSSIPSGGGISSTLLASEESDAEEDEAEVTLAVLDEDDSEDSESEPGWAFSSQSIFNREFPSSSPVGQAGTNEASDEDVTEESATEDEDEPAEAEAEDPQDNDTTLEEEPEPEEPDEDLRTAVAESEEDEGSDDEPSSDEEDDASTTEEEDEEEREPAENSNKNRDSEGNREDNDVTPTPSPERDEQEDEPAPIAVQTEEPAPTATPTPTPTQAPRPQAASNPSVETIKREFTAGYRSAGGSEGYLSHILNTVIPCESSYNVRAYNPAGPYYGLMQFLESTWMRVGGGDWYDPWQQGANTARLLQSARPETQWPYCWKR